MNNTENLVTLKLRKPSGKPSWPRVLLSGEEGSGKAWAAAMLSTDERLGGMVWLGLGTGLSVADEYGAIPGADYQWIDHDGTWRDIYGQLCLAWEHAKAVAEAGDLPIALTVDSMTDVWAMLCDLVDVRSRRREARRQLGADVEDVRDATFDPDVEVVSHRDLWKIVNRRHAQFMAKVHTWPGPVVMTSREKQVTDSVDPDASKVYAMEAQKGLGYEATAWVRLSRDLPPELVKLRSVKWGLQIDDEDARWSRADFTVARLVFDWVGCGVDSTAPVHRELDADQVMPEEIPPAVAALSAARAEAAPQEAENPEEVAVAWLTLNAKAGLVGLLARTKAIPDALSADVSTVLTVDDRRALGIDEEVVTMKQLVRLVGKYVIRFGRAVRSPDAGMVAA